MKAFVQWLGFVWFSLVAAACPAGVVSAGGNSSSELARTVSLFFEHATQTVRSALLYAMLLVCFIILPIYAVFLLRRRVARRVERFLEEVARWDPWRQAQLTDAGFAGEKPIAWLRELGHWRRNYSRASLVFGLPDLNAKFLELGRALIRLYHARADDVRQLDAARRQEIIDGLHQFEDSPLEDEAYQVIESLETGFEGRQKDLRRIGKQADSVDTWVDLLELMQVPSHASPEEAASHPALTTEHATPALFVLAREKPVQWHPKLVDLLRRLHTRFGQRFRVTAVRVDSFLQAGGTLIRELREILGNGELEEENALERFEACVSWRLFQRLFQDTPFETMEISPNASFGEARIRYRQERAKLRHGRPEEAEANQQRREQLTLAWEVIRELKERGKLN